MRVPLRRFSASVKRPIEEDISPLSETVKLTARTYFMQAAPRIGNVYDEDDVFVRHMKHILPTHMHAAIDADLRRFGARVAQQVGPLGHASDRAPPTLTHYDGWGVRVDTVETSEAWRQLQRIAVEEELMGIGYRRREFGALARVYQFAKMYLFAGACAVADCPLAMTNGAAKLADEADALTRELCFERLTTTDVSKSTTSGQWMTERSGGSDVGGTETVAMRLDDERDAAGEPMYELHGYKYFTSAIDSGMAFALARVVDRETGEGVRGSRGLSLFHVEVREPSGALNRIAVHKLKDKLGTRAVPTAELELRGTRARLVGEVGRGVPRIATLFNITRIHNATAAVAMMRRAISYVRDYARRRTAFGGKLSDNALYQAALADMETECRGSFHMLFDSVAMLGKSEVDADEDAARVLRLATPLLKLFTAERAIAVAVEAIEAIGGQAYMEDSGMPRLLRDGMVLQTWEGGKNVMALDFLRALHHDRTGLDLFARRCESMAQEKHVPALAAARKSIEQALALAKGAAPHNARAIALAASNYYCAALTSAAAGRSNGANSDKEVAERWINKLLPLSIMQLKQITEKPGDLQALAYGEEIGFKFGQDKDNQGNVRPRL